MIARSSPNWPHLWKLREKETKSAYFDASFAENDADTTYDVEKNNVSTTAWAVRYEPFTVREL